MATDTDLAWLAGIWDGEGTITMTHQRERKLCPLISVTNTDVGIVNRVNQIVSELGCSIHINEGRGKKSTRPYYTVSTSRHEYIKIILEAIEPFLQGEKKHKAQLLLSFVNRRIQRLSEGKHTKAAMFEPEDYEISQAIRSSSTTRETL